MELRKQFLPTEEEAAPSAKIDCEADVKAWEEKKMAAELVADMSESDEEEPSSSDTVTHDPKRRRIQVDSDVDMEHEGGDDSA